MRKDTSDNRNKRKSRKRSTSAASKETTFKSRRRSRSKQLSQVENDIKTIEATPLHENFRDYTPEELLQIKKDVCLAHQCTYLSRLHFSTKKGSPYSMTCNYILIAGHSRGCMPDVCTHYNDHDVKKTKHLSAYSNQ